MDPIDGDPATIRTHAARYTAAAEAITRAVAMLRGVTEIAGGEHSEAVEALSERIDNATERLADVRSRYEAAGSELQTYAGALEDAQADADRAVTLHDGAAAEIARLEISLHNAEDDRDAATDPTVRAEAQQRVTTLRQHISEHQRELAEAQTLHGSAVEAARTAGDVAAAALAQVVSSDGLNDSWWDNVMDWVSANAEWLTVVKNVLGAITAVIGVISIFFPVLAPVAFLLGGLTAVLSFGLAASGSGSWLEFGMDMLGALTFGVGAVAARGVTLGLRGMQAMRGLSANRSLTTFGQRLFHPIATRRTAIRLAGDSMQEALPAGQTLITRVPGTFRRTWLEASGVGVEQFTHLATVRTLGSGSIRSAFVEGLVAPAASMYRGTQAAGTAFDVVGLSTAGLEQWNNAEGLPDVPVLDQVAAWWGDVQTATTAPLSSPGWHTNAGS